MIRDIVINARSYRSFDENRPLSKEELEGFLDTARLCSSAMNKQALKYRVVSESAQIFTAGISQYSKGCGKS